MKKTLSVLLSAVMLFCTLGVMPFSASADGAQKSGECGYGVNYRIDPDAGILNIMATDESTGVMYDYDNQESPFYFCNDYYIISVWEGVTSIGSYAFQANRYLDEVALPSTLTKINRNAFANCESMFMINFPTNLTTIGAYAFHNCYALEKILLNDNLKTVGDYAFYNCNACDTLKIGSSVTRIGTEAFRNLKALKSVSIPAAVKEIGSGAFDNCSSLNSVNISSLKAWCNITFKNETSNPTNCSHELELNGKPISALVIPSGIKSVKPYAFTYCKSLTSVTVPEGVTSIGTRAFGGCSGVTKVTLPKSLKSIDENAFEYCSGIKDVYYNGSKSDWNKIKIGIRNISVTEAKIHFAAPGQVKNLKLTKGSKQLKASWKKVSGAKGYQVRYSLKKNMKGAKTKAVKANKATVKSLKSGKTYYVQARAYKTSGGKKHYGSWSAKKKIKVG